MGNSVVRAGSKQPQVGGGDKGQQTPYDPDTGGYSPVAGFDPQQAYAEQQRRNAATDRAKNLSAQVNGELLDFNLSLSLGEGDVANFFQSEQTRSFLSDRALAGDGLDAYRAGLAPGIFANAIMPVQGISDNELKAFLGTNALAGDFVGSAFNGAFGPLGDRGGAFGQSQSGFTQFLNGADNIFTSIGALDASLKFANGVDSISTFGLGINQIAGSSFDAKSLSALFEGRYLNSVRDPFIALGNTSKFEKLLSFADILDNSLIKGVGGAVNILSPVVSGAKTYNHVSLKGNGFDSEGKLLLGKAVVDSAFAGASFLFPVGTAAAGIYGIADFFVNGTEYRGNNGQVYTEWRGVAERFNDQQNNNPVIPFRLEGF